MSLHESIVTDLNRLIDGQGGVDIISPTSLALALQATYAEAGALKPQIAYASLEHLKQMARRALSGRYGAESDDTEAHQGELFSGELQSRYPVPHKRGDDPIYKLLDTMSDAEIQWNETSLERSADARMIHARALRAYRLSRAQAA
jgi:hypothetical protein